MKQLRDIRRLTQEDVASAVGVKRATYANYESGNRNPSVKVLKKLSVFFGVPVEYLLGEINQETVRKFDNRIPVLGSVPAGVPIEAIEDIEEYIDIYPRFVKHGELFALRVQGNSMEPDLRSGDIAIVEKQDFVETGDVAVIRVNGQDVTLKRVKINSHGLTLIPTNPAYDPVFFNPTEIDELPITIIGKVVEVRRRL